MSSLHKELVTSASIDKVWDALRDIGALHTRLVPGFVVDTKLEPGARIVTFANGHTVRERILSVDDATRRVAWSATGGLLEHHNASAQVFEEPYGKTRVAWIADLLPDSAAETISQMMDHGMRAMQSALDRLA